MTSSRFEAAIRHPASPRNALSATGMSSTRLSAASALLILAVLLVQSSTAFAFAPVNGNWESQSLVYSPRDKFGLVCDDDRIYIFGGRLSSSVYTDTIFKYNVTSLKWQQVFPTGEITPRFAGGMKKVGSSFYHYFGYSDESLPAPTTQVWRYDLTLNHWSLVEMTQGTNTVTARARFSSTVFGDKVFVFMGMTESGITNEVWSIDTVNKLWTREHDGSGTEGTDVPSKRFDPCCVFYASRNQSVCFAGTSELGDTHDLWGFSHATNTWTKFAEGSSAPEDRRLAACEAPDDNTFIAFSGWQSGRADFDCGNEVWKYTFTGGAGGAWVRVPYNVNAEIANDRCNVATISTSATRATPRDSSQMCKTRDGIFLIGGASPGGRLNDVAKYNTANGLLEKVASRVSLPPARWGHNTAVIGTTMVIVFGANGDGAMVSPWALDLTNPDNLQWSSWKVNSEPGGRQGASVVVRGNIMYFFGGILADGTHTNELLLLNTDVGHDQSGTREFKYLFPVGTAPTGRAWHGAALLNGRMIILGGMTSTSSSKRQKDIYVFDFKTNTWADVAGYYGLEWENNFEKRSHFPMLSDPTETSMLVIGGLSSITLSDRYEVSVIDPTADTWNFTFTKKPSIAPGGDVYRIFRGEHVAAGIGRHYYVCGGSISKSFPTLLGYSCYHYDETTGTHTHFADTPELVASKSTVVHFGRRLYQFGGEFATGAVKRKIPLNNLLVYKLADTEVCKFEGGATDSACVHCSAGTKNPAAASAECVFAPAGSFAKVAWEVETPCETGRYSRVIAGRTNDTCQVCPRGTFGNTTGRVSCVPCNTPSQCPLGSSSGVAKVATPAPTPAPPCDNTTGCRLVVDAAGGAVDTPLNLTATQSKRYVNGDIPIEIFLAVGGFVILLLSVFMILVMCGYHQKNKDYQFFFTPDSINKLHENVFLKYQMPGYGISEAMMFNALNEPEVRLMKGVTFEMVTEAFRGEDVDGSGFADFEEFLAIIIGLTVTGQCVPQKGTEAENYLDEHKTLQRDGCRQRLRDLRFSRVDMFLTGHRIGKIGDPIRLQRTSIGGIITVIMCFIALVLVAAIVIDFFYRNTIESRGTMPAVVLDERDPIRAEQTIIQVAARGSGSCPTNCATSSFAKGAVSNTDASRFQEACTPVYDTDTTIVEDCLYTVMLANFAVEALNSDTLQVRFQPDLFANQVEVYVSTTTGVLGNTNEVEQLSTTKVWMYPTQAVFRGYPASSVNLQLVPTAFSKEHADFIQNPSEERSGYHIQFANRSAGNSVSETSFAQVFGVPVDVHFFVGDVILTIDRKLQQTWLQLMSSILGTLSGLSGAALLIVKFIDGRRQRYRDNEFQNFMDERQNDIASRRNNTSAGSGMYEQHLRDRGLIDPLVTGGVNITVATETLKLMRKVANEAVEPAELQLKGRTESARRMQKKRADNWRHHIQGELSDDRRESIVSPHQSSLALHQSQEQSFFIPPAAFFGTPSRSGEEPEREVIIAGAHDVESHTFDSSRESLSGELFQIESEVIHPPPHHRVNITSPDSDCLPPGGKYHGARRQTLPPGTDAEREEFTRPEEHSSSNSSNREEEHDDQKPKPLQKKKSTVYFNLGNNQAVDIDTIETPRDPTTDPFATIGQANGQARRPPIRRRQAGQPRQSQYEESTNGTNQTAPFE